MLNTQYTRIMADPCWHARMCVNNTRKRPNLVAIAIAFVGRAPPLREYTDNMETSAQAFWHTVPPTRLLRALNVPTVEFG